MRTYCTLFDTRYLARALALYHSLARHDPGFELWTLCLDDASVDVVARMALPGVHVVPVGTLEAADPSLVGVRPSRSQTEYYFTLTPAWVSHVMTHVDDGDWVSYVDADMLFYSSPQPVFDELAGASVGIIAHRFPDGLRRMERYGRYNVGLVAFRNDAAGRRVVEDWRARCLDWCFNRLEDGRFGDQKYLDAWPQQFDGVHVIAHAGAGVGPWNWMIHAIDVAQEPPRVDGAPLIFYHFHGFRFVGERLYDSGLATFARMPRALFQRLYGAYARELVRRSTEAGLALEKESLWRWPRTTVDLRQLMRRLWGILSPRSGMRLLEQSEADG